MKIELFPNWLKLLISSALAFSFILAGISNFFGVIFLVVTAHYIVKIFMEYMNQFD